MDDYECGLEFIKTKEEYMKQLMYPECGGTGTESWKSPLGIDSFRIRTKFRVYLRKFYYLRKQIVSSNNSSRDKIYFKRSSTLEPFTTLAENQKNLTTTAQKINQAK